MSESWLSNGAYFSTCFFFKPRKPILVCLLDNILGLDKMFSSFWEPRALVPPRPGYFSKRHCSSHDSCPESPLYNSGFSFTDLMNSELMTGEVKLKTWSTTTRWATRSPQDRVLRNCDGKLLKEEVYMLTSNIYAETFKIIRQQKFVVCRLFRNKRSIQKRRESCLHSLYPKVSDILFYLNFLSMYISFIYLLFLLLYFKLQ